MSIDGELDNKPKVCECTVCGTTGRGQAAITVSACLFSSKSTAFSFTLMVNLARCASLGGVLVKLTFTTLRLWVKTPSKLVCREK